MVPPQALALKWAPEARSDDIAPPSLRAAAAAESWCKCSSYITSKRLLQLLSHLLAHTGRHLGHGWPNVEARVEIRGHSVERAVDHCPPRQRSDLQKQGVPMSQRGGFGGPKHERSTQG
eukprot:CAMPEP_0174709070 /NCGR_PEP_ID=MMETSP1094-20130205/11145_1 /TAXON_ID=156173 /ORGANISM="Chrysochromulina brevifilum, Strain UTEX LB 985" /LENGTH=118 /DNA_ID=CAMNT_0015907711 /DNA_START=170 /DNA_END=527 /DNA_ORIENTATION=+